MNISVRPHRFVPGTPYPLEGEIQRSVQTSKTNEVVFERVPLDREHLPQLPPKENFSLENQLKAGIPLQQVNSQVLPSNPNGCFTPVADSIANQVIDKLESEPEPPKQE